MNARVGSIFIVTNMVHYLENSLQTHDIAVPFSLGGSNKVFRVLVVTESMVTNSSISQTMARVLHFASLSGGVFSAILFFAPPKVEVEQTNAAVEAITAPANPHPLQPLQTLQMALHNANICMLCLYLEAPNVLPDILKNLTASSPEMAELMPEIPNAGTDLLPFCATDGPMDQAAFTAISDISPDLRDLASLDDKPARMRKMASAGLGEKKMEACLSYWNEEWVAE
jgi:hypothetical protein